MSPITAEKALYDDLLSIYARAGAEVTYETDKGEIKAYWAKRFLQAVKRSGNQEELFEFVRRLVCSEEPSRGFYILKKAGRLDLTVEALIIDGEKPYNGELDFEVLERARHRLADHDYEDAFSATPSKPTPTPSNGNGTPAFEPPGLVPGASFEVRVTVGHDGRLSLALI
jgi:hypothetical protein